MPAVVKCSIVAVLLLIGSLEAQAQLLPVPGAKNPNWSLMRKKVVQPTQIRSGDRMPNATFLGPTGGGNHRYYWDARRQLRYEWDTQPGGESPLDSVKVHDDDTGTMYIYRQLSLPAAPRQWRRIPSK
jgi:hypothetical protein